MKVSPHLKFNLGKLAVIAVGYLLFSLFVAFFNIAMLNSSFSLGGSASFDPETYLWVNVMVGLVAGIGGGSVLIFVNGQVFRRKSFRFAMGTTALAYVIMFVFITLLATAIRAGAVAAEDNASVFSEALETLMQPITIAYFIMWGVVTMFTLFLLQVNDKFGPGVLVKFLKGRYHEPKVEERVFMFLDMRSSTTIAEKIGNEAYFSLLNDLFANVTNTILNHEGEIYQYVGDEIVMSWPLSRGIRNANCVNCFIQIQKKLEYLAPKYEEKYGVAPQFKAGVHHGEVMAGEIGVIKKDIIYSGDTLNTTARIQGKCNDYKVDFLMSQDTFDLLPNKTAFELITIGSIELRGKEQKVDLITIKMG
jgi:adenylate cyclase